MKLIFYFLLFQIPIIASAQSVLLTGFKPFAGRASNTSYEIAEEAKTQLQKMGIEVETCEVPVVYSQAFEVVRDCYLSLSKKPSIMISMGESSSAIEFNLGAHNYAGDYPDENGISWGNRRILKSGDKELELSLSAEKLFCSMSPYFRKKTIVAKDAGDFLCNFLAYRMSDYLIGSDTSYTFLHVPVLGNDEVKIKRNAKILALVIYRQVKNRISVGSAKYNQCLEDFEQKSPK